jgi:hypothetical protein
MSVIHDLSDLVHYQSSNPKDQTEIGYSCHSDQNYEVAIPDTAAVAVLGPTPQHCAFVNGSAYGTFLRVCITARPIGLRAVWLTNGPPINFKRLYSRLETTSRGRLSGHLKRFLERLTNHAGEVTGYLSRPQKPHRRPQSRPHRRPSDSLLVDLLPNRVGHLRYSVILRTMSSRPAL